MSVNQLVQVQQEFKFMEFSLVPFWNRRNCVKVCDGGRSYSVSDLSEEMRPAEASNTLISCTRILVQMCSYYDSDYLFLFIVIIKEKSLFAYTAVLTFSLNGE